MNIAAVVTTGGSVDGEFARAIGTARKALAVIHGSVLLDATIKALRGAGVERIALVGGPEVRERFGDAVEKVIDESASGAANQLRALRAWEDEPGLLYATSDMPYITANALRDVIERTGEHELTMPLTAYADFERRFPAAPNFGITLGGERVVNGGVFMIPAGTARKIEALALALFEARKKPMAMARIAGLPLLARFAFRRLAVHHVEERASRVLGFPVRALRNAAPELAYDIDTYEEHVYAASHA